MTDLDAAIRSSIEQWTPDRAANWADVVARARVRRSRRPLVTVAIVAAALVLGAAALAETVGHGFSGWLEGSPGTSAPASDKAALDRTSWVPLDPQLDVRELLTAESGGRTYRLIGFRTGGAVCLKVVDAGTGVGPGIACTAGDQLRHSHDLAVPLAVDKPLTAGSGPQATYGLVAAGTRRVVLEGDDGRRNASVANGAFLALGRGSAIQHTTLRGYAVDARGRRRPIPLAPALTREIGQFRTGLPLLGPKQVERTVRRPSIGWLVRREPRGKPVPKGLAAVLYHPRPATFPSRLHWTPQLNVAGGDFARMIQPDPQDFLRIVIGRTRLGALCYSLVTRGGAGGGCNPPATVFGRGPLDGGTTYSGVGSQSVMLAGIAADQVARLELFLGNGVVQPVALRDNAFVGRIQRAELPARLVAYDAAGRIIAIQNEPME